MGSGILVGTAVSAHLSNSLLSYPDKVALSCSCQSLFQKESIPSIPHPKVDNFVPVPLLMRFPLFSSEIAKHEEVSGAHASDHKSLHQHSPHSAIGITLVLGFVFMLCVEQCVNKHTSVNYSAVSTSIEEGAPPPVSRRKSSKLTATIGLIVHSAGK